MHHCHLVCHSAAEHDKQLCRNGCDAGTNVQDITLQLLYYWTPSHTTALHPDVRTTKFDHDITVAFFFYRAVINRDTYYSKAYQCSTSGNSYTVSYIDGGTIKYGFNQCFLSFSFDCVAVIEPLIPTSYVCYPQLLQKLFMLVSS